MSRKDAHAFAASLAATLMVSIVVFQAGDGTFGAVPADEIDGDEVVIVSTGSQGEPMAALSRIANREHPVVEVGPGDTVLLASSLIPGRSARRSVTRTKSPAVTARVR